MYSSRSAADPFPTLRHLAAGLLFVLASSSMELQAAPFLKEVYMQAGTGLSRTQSTSTATTTLNKSGDATGGFSNTATWTLSPALAGDLTLAANTNVAIYFWSTCAANPTARTMGFSLGYDATPAGIGSLTGQALTYTTCGTYQLMGPYNIPVGASDVTINAGSTLTLTITNETTGGAGGARRVLVRPSDGATNRSRAEYQVNTIINVDSVQVYTAAYNGGSVDTGIDAGDTGWFRAVVSDPFGDYDIEPTTDQAVLTVTGPNPGVGVLFGPVNMTNVGADGSTLTKTFEYQYTVAEFPTPGIYTATVVADEGVEGTVSHTGTNASIVIDVPSVSLTRLSTAYSDPVNNTTNPKRVPGAIVTHTITGQNDGGGRGGTIVLLEQLSATSEYDVGYGVVFSAGTSGLTAPTVTYSTNACASFVNNLTPTGPYDASVRCIRIAMGGNIARNTGTPPSFTVSYRARVP
jgi:hypothetical protein